VRDATVRTIYTHINAQAQSAALALSPKITVLDDAELATNAAENFDATGRGRIINSDCLGALSRPCRNRTQ